jgi:hypothetical protein
MSSSLVECLDDVVFVLQEEVREEHREVQVWAWSLYTLSMLLFAVIRHDRLELPVEELPEGVLHEDLVVPTSHSKRRYHAVDLALKSLQVLQHAVVILPGSKNSY